MSNDNLLNQPRQQGNWHPFLGPHDQSQERQHDALELPIFDGYPYLITRVLTGMYHIMLLSEIEDRDRLRELAVDQTTRNRLDAALVYSRSDCLYVSKSSLTVTPSGSPPIGGAIVSHQLKPLQPARMTPDLRARRTRLDAFIKSLNQSGYFVGNGKSEARQATESDLRTLAGWTADGVPKGLSNCDKCGDWHGECLDPSEKWAGLIMRVHCICENHNRCAACGGLLYKRRLNANYYNPTDNEIWHVPGFSGIVHKCSAPFYDSEEETSDE